MPFPWTKTGEQISESVTLTEGLSVDAERGVVSGVKILGSSSANGRRYTAACMQAARGLYEGARVNVDHPAGDPLSPRSYADRFGLLKNVSYRESGLFGDLHYNPKHRLAEQFAHDAANSPQNVGLSHNVLAKLGKPGDDGRQTVESINRVVSVDVVADPATNRSLFEHEEAAMPRSLKKVVESLKPGRFRSVLEMMIDDDAALATAPVDAPEEAPADDQIKAAFRSAVVAAFDDESMDTTATLAKIREILKAFDKMKDAPGGSESSGEETTAEESLGLKSLEKKLDAFLKLTEQSESRENAKAVLESLGSSATAVGVERFDLLLAQPDADAMRKLAESWSPSVLGKRPPFGGVSPTKPAAAMPDNSASLIEMLRS